MPLTDQLWQELQRLDLIAHLRDNAELKDLGNLKTMLGTASRSIKLYDEEISSLYIRIDELKGEQRALKAQVLVGRSVLAPIRCIPNEILAEIFQYSCWDGFPMGDNRAPTVYIISSVCMSWKRLAMGIPELWVRLFASIDGMREGPYSSVKAGYLRGVLPLSQDLPLSLPGEIFCNSQFSEILSMLKPLLHRCHHSHNLTPKSSSDLKQLLQSLPNLSDCSIDMKNISAPLNLAFLTPNLRRVELRSATRELHLNWRLLTNLSVSLIDAGIVFGILARAPLIEHLSIAKLNNILLPSSHSIISLQYLSYLSVSLPTDGWSGDKNNRRYFLHFLQGPNLSYLDLGAEDEESDGYGPMTPHDALFPLLRHSRSSLRTLKMDFLVMHTSSLLQCLREVPYLTCFVYHSWGYIDDRKWFSKFLQAMTVNADTVWKAREDPLLPNLIQIDLLVDGDCLEDRLFIEMVTSRWRSPRTATSSHSRSVASLQSVRLGVRSRQFDESLWQDLQYRQVQGLKVGVLDQGRLLYQGCDVRTRVEDQK